MPEQPQPLHRPAKAVDGVFLGSVRNTDYYLKHDAQMIVMVRSTPGHLVTSEQGVAGVVLVLLSWGESGMANRIRAAASMMRGT